MRWEDGRRSSNVEDRRGMTSRPAFVGGGLGTIVLVLLALYFGVDPTFLLQNAPVGQVGEEQPAGPPPGTDGVAGQPDPAVEFVATVLADTEDTWTAVFAESGQQYEVPKLELQADCFAGIWAHRADRTRQILETGDVDEALTAASAIGDDRLQQQSRGYVTPDSFTHGSAEQRVRWFKRGIDSGQVDACDTFAAKNL